MKRPEINATIAEDLKHIPHAAGIQAELRMLYNSRRHSDLSISKSRKETMAYCIEVIKKLYRGEQPDYDKVYFEVGE